MYQLVLVASLILGSGSAGAAAPGAHLTPNRDGAQLMPTARGPLSGRVIVVDPGHNGRYVRRINTRLVPSGEGRRKACNTAGTSGRGLVEHQLTWDLGKRLAARLRAHGATVVLTRPNDAGVGPCVNERAAIANRHRADLSISLHADGNDTPGARGFHVITSTRMGSAASERSSAALAARVRGQMEARTGLVRSTYIGGGTAISRRGDIAGLNLLARPGVMVEVGNVRNRTDAALLSRASTRDQLALAVTTAAQAQLTAR